MSNAKPGTTTQHKRILEILDPVEWMSTPDISSWLGIDVSSFSNMLKLLQNGGKVERMYDGNIGRTYWKLPAGEGFHKASEEVSA